VTKKIGILGMLFDENSKKLLKIWKEIVKLSRPQNWKKKKRKKKKTRPHYLVWHLGVE
jgi:hypothetical protein